MKKPQKIPKQPAPAELHSLHQLFQAGNMQQAESIAESMLKEYPKAPSLLNVLGLCQQHQGKLLQAASSFKKLLTVDPGIAEVHFNLAILLTQLDKVKDAVASYRKAIKLKPDMTSAHFNLGTLLQSQGFLSDAAKYYRKAVTLDPDFFQAQGNLGAVLQQQGLLEEAEQCYRKNLSLHPDARAHFNLGTVLYGLGQHKAAREEFRNSLALAPDFADAWNSLGETQRDYGEMDKAILSYKKALEIDSDHDRAKYNMGEYLCLVDKLEDAIPYFEASHFADSQERALQCLYKSRQFDLFKQKFDNLIVKQKHTTVLLGTLSTHYATNFGQKNQYTFCDNPMDFVLKTHIDELIDKNNSLLEDLVHDITHLAIAERQQSRLYYGIQSAGNLLLRSEASFQSLATLIIEKVKNYRKYFAGSRNRLIKDFPKNIEFTSSWFIKMKQGGHLTSHIHEEGWISGCVYLKLPDRMNGHEGSFSYSTDGDDYPRLNDDFPSQIVDVNVGDLVLFPSSLFHQTIPFCSDQERVCVAFDIKPAIT